MFLLFSSSNDFSCFHRLVYKFIGHLGSHHAEYFHIHCARQYELIGEHVSNFEAENCKELFWNRLHRYPSKVVMGRFN